jgi:hypothetical protein
MIGAGVTPITLQRKPHEAVLVIHLVPASFLDRQPRIDIGTLREENVDAPQPGQDMSFGGRYNLDGFALYTRVIYSTKSDIDTMEYRQVFRSGALEIVDVYNINVKSKKRLMVGARVEKEIVNQLQPSMKFLKKHAVPFPVYGMVSILRVKGWTMVNSTDDPDEVEELPGFDRDDLILPDVEITSADDDVAKLMRPAFDALWQAAGWSRSPTKA